MKSRSFVMAYTAVMAVSVCFLVLLFQAAAEYPSPVPAADVAPPDMAQVLQSHLGGQQAQLTLLYQTRNYRPLWLSQNGLSPDGRQALAILAAAETEALPAAHYAVPQPPDARAPDASKADFDIALTGAVLRYAADLRWGAWRPEQLFDDAQMARESDDVAAGLFRAADGGNAAVYLRSLAPSAREYSQLRDALTRYRAIAAGGDWPLVAAETGSSSQNMARLAARLQREAYLPPDVPTQADIAAALRSWQVDNSVTQTGRLDSRTVALLNVSAATRAQQIAANMERMRWMPHTLGTQYILVNVADASLALMESGQAVLTSRVVVGKPNKTTPILATQAVSVTVNPAWHVPPSIVRREIRPKGGGYMAAKNMFVKDGQVIQRPGPGNALGVVKFEMPNDFNVYLHDTPTKTAFLAEDRALSHGCVRVQQIRPLAEHVLGLSDQALQNLISRGRTDGRRLAAPIPVYIQYWTAMPRDDGHIAFRDDIYHRDARMTQAMFPGQVPLLVASR